MENSLSILINKSLPSISHDGVSYNKDKNVFLTTGYTSAAGNTYYRAIRLSGRLAIDFSLGQGWKYTFLNGIRLYCYDGQQTKLIGQKLFNSHIFSEYDAKENSVLMLTNYLEGEAKLLGNTVSHQEIIKFSRSMIEATQARYIA